MLLYALASKQSKGAGNAPASIPVRIPRIKCDATFRQRHICMAEREGFEPSVPLPAHCFSRAAPSTTRSPLRL